MDQAFLQVVLSTMPDEGKGAFGTSRPGLVQNAALQHQLIVAGPSYGIFLRLLERGLLFTHSPRENRVMLPGQ
jgi:hypothetical protein